MKTLALIGGDAPLILLPEDALKVYWEKRDVKTPEISLPALLDEWLLQIRSENMEWAFETGKQKMPGSEKTLAETLSGGCEPSMWWTSLIYERHPKQSSWLYPVYKLRCLEKLIEQHKCKKLLVIDGDKKLIGTLKCFAKDFCMDFESAGRRKKSSEKFLSRIYFLMPAIIRSLARFCHWCWKIKRFLPFAGKDFLNSCNYNALPAAIATYFPNIDLKAAAEGRFCSRYWEDLHKALNRQAKYEGIPHFVRWLFIRFSSPDLTFRQCLELKKRFNKEGRDGLSFNCLEEFLDKKDIGTSLLRWLKICFASICTEKYFKSRCHFAGSKLNFWEYAKEQWGESFRGWRCLERCLQNQAFMHYFKLCGKFRWCLYPLENCAWERMFVYASHLHNNKTYGFQHSIIRPTDFRYFDDALTFKELPFCSFQPDKCGVNGQSGYEQLVNNGIPASKICVLEALRYLYLEKAVKESKEAGNDLPPQAGEPLRYFKSKRLLVVTSFFRDETEAHFALFAKAINAGLLDGWDIVIKPHPCLSVQEWLKPEYKNIKIAAGAISLELAEGVSVWASNSTTAALEAVLKGLPIMVMRPVNDFDLCPIQNIRGLLRTGSLEEVRYGLENMKPVKIPENYLDLNNKLCAWRKLLDLNYLE